MSRLLRTHAFLLAAFIGQAFPQTAMVSGLVRDSVTLEPLVGANISLVGTNRGDASSVRGTFVIGRIPPGSYTLRTSFIGYAHSEMPIALQAGDSLFLDVLLQPEHVETEEVVTTATRTVRNIADVPVRIEIIPQEEVEEKLLMTPSSVAMLLNESTGMRVQTTSPTSNAANLRIQGLSGRYTQILTDGIPSFGGLASGFGLMQLLPLNLRQVEVIKGATSALYGPDAISGVVNFITKDPGSEPELHAIVNGTTQRGLDIAGFFAHRFEQFGFTILASRNAQALFDVEGDGFGDVAQFERYTFSPKFLWDLSEDVRLRATVGLLQEERFGGVTDEFRRSVGGAGYFERMRTERLDITSQLDWRLAKDDAITVKIAGTRSHRDAHYGGSAFDATQEVIYADAQYSFKTRSHTLLVGTAFNLEDFTDRSPLEGARRSYRFESPAVFMQDEVVLAPNWSLVMSGRIDFHNRFGTFFTPRASLMHRPSALLAVRIGGGTGFKIPTIFTEEAEEAGFRKVHPLNAIHPEKAMSGSFDLNWRVFTEEVGATINIAFYITSLSNALLADGDSLQRDVVYLRNASGSTLTRGGECSVKLTHGNLKLSLGYTYLFGTQSDDGRSYELELNPRNSVGVVLVWEEEEASFKAGIENYWTGSMRLERNPFRERSPGNWITGVIAEKGFGSFRLFVNLENIFDTRQTRFDPLFVGNLREGTIRTLPVYAPLEGRVVNAGIRFVL